MRGLGGSWVLDRTWYEDAEIFARGLVRAGLDDVRRVDAVSPTVRRAAVFAGGAPAATADLSCTVRSTVILERIATRGRPKEKDVSRRLLGRAARALRAVDRAIPALSGAARSTSATTTCIADPSADRGHRRRGSALQLEGELPQTELWPAVAAEARVSR